MRIGVVSDTHDRQEAVAEAVRLLMEQHVELILHCGDIESPETVRLFDGVPTHFVFGNCDHDRGRLREEICAIGAALHEPWGEVELAGKKIAWLHGHERRLKAEVEAMDHFDYLFYGHTHDAEQHRVGRTLVVNPGALYRAVPKQCVVLNLEREELESVVVAR
jgi:putative phosphoesterase